MKRRKENTKGTCSLPQGTAGKPPLVWLLSTGGSAQGQTRAPCCSRNHSACLLLGPGKLRAQWRPWHGSALLQYAGSEEPWASLIQCSQCQTGRKAAVAPQWSFTRSLPQTHSFKSNYAVGHWELSSEPQDMG